MNAILHIAILCSALYAPRHQTRADAGTLRYDSVQRYIDADPRNGRWERLMEHRRYHEKAFPLPNDNLAPTYFDSMWISESKA